MFLWGGIQRRFLLNSINFSSYAGSVSEGVEFLFVEVQGFRFAKVSVSGGGVELILVEVQGFRFNKGGNVAME
jgi:hypothetical protein